LRNVSFSDRFELLNPIREDEVQIFSARERATGRVVQVHFAPSLEMLSGLDLQANAVLDRGTHDSKHYVVTTVPAVPGSLDSAGAWRIKPVAPVAADASAAPGDFTRMFQLRQAPEPVAEPVAKPVKASPASQPGEFTRAFQKPVSAPSAPAVGDSGNPSAGQPGEFTRMFQTPAKSPVQTAPAVVEPVPAVPQPASQSLKEETAAGAETAAPARTPVAYIVVAAALLFAIAVFIWMRKLY
jgi:hypothetical protein